MSQALDIKNWYISNFETFEKSLNGESSLPIHNIRKDAIEKFSQLNFPSVKEEEWRFTNLSPLFKHNFNPAVEKTKLTKQDIKRFLFEELNAAVITFVNGIFTEELSNLEDLPAGIEIKSISQAINDESPVLKEHFSKYAKYDKDIFIALSAAFTKDGAFIKIDDGKLIEKPVHILFIADARKEKYLTQPRNLIVAGKNSQSTIIEHYVTLSEDIYFTNSVTEIIAEENAVVDHLKLQEESKNSFHIARMEVDQERTSNFSSHAISFGADLSRNEFNSRFNDEGGECTLNGLYLIGGTQLCDTHTLIDHAKPNCNSHEHYKGILDDKSRGVFSGKVLVRKDAQKTNAFQENNNIILSDNALVNTKPQLEIFADDVKCSHGATIGQLDADALFYLKSRGIGPEASRSILIHAFASDVIKSIKVEAIRNYIEEILSEKFNTL